MRIHQAKKEGFRIWFGNQSGIRFLGLVLFFWIFSGCHTQEQATKWLEITEQVNGTLGSKKHIRVLKLWGTNYEMGYAHGYLLGPESLELAELELSQPGILGFYENEVLPNLHLFNIPEPYLDEIKGFYAGMKARAEGGVVYSKKLDREINLNDVIASNFVNSMGEEIYCASFSAWGNMTDDGRVIAGYNRDGPDGDRHTGRWLLIVRVPAEQTGLINTVSIGRAGNINIASGMNAYGVVMSCQAILRDNTNEPTSTEGFTSEGVVFRNLMDSMDHINPVGDMERILHNLYTHEAEAPLYTWPRMNDDIPSAALEIDGDLTVNNGFTLRRPGLGEDFLIQTNIFHIRYKNSKCLRYDQCYEYFKSIKEGKNKPLTLDSAWEVLGNELHPLMGGNLLTQYAVVFEPKKKRMHIAVYEPDTDTHSGRRITVNVDELVKIQ